MSVSQRISQTAARWLIRQREGITAAEEQAQFTAWLEAHPDHKREYDSLHTALSQLNQPQQLQRVADAAEQHAFLAKADKRKKLQSRLSQAACVLVMLLAGWMAHLQYQHWQAAPVMQMAMQNPVGRIVTNTLADGSRVTLSASSEMAVTFYRHQRHVLLKKGEAVFEVAKSADRPFVVETDTTRVTVLGTRFAVNKLPQLVRVSVDHGQVQVESIGKAASASPPQIITNGQVLEVSIRGSSRLVNRPASDAFAFLSGRLVFERADANEVAATLSRYRHKPVIAQGKPSASLSADLDIHDIESFLHGLPHVSAMTVSDSPGMTVIRQP